MSFLIEPKRKDFLEMLIHHTVTVAVISVSYLYGWNRIGLPSLMVHWHFVSCTKMSKSNLPSIQQWSIVLTCNTLAAGVCHLWLIVYLRIL